MPAILINSRVADFKQWQKTFEENEPMRQAAGITSASVWQAHGDPNNIFMVLECTDIARVKRFNESEELKQAMAKAGVLGQPTVSFLGECWKYPRQAVYRE